MPEIKYIDVMNKKIYQQAETITEVK